jgi:IPT/TIG domain-containing protein
MFRNHPIRSLLLAALVVGVAVAVPVTAAAKPKAPAKPMITKISPTSAKPGAKITIDGKRFVHVTAVKIDNLKAKHAVDSAVKITATVPKGAKTGKVEVVTKAGTAMSVHLLKVV